ncbi:hypothetical protein D9756_001063 [Leucocoprinus leucothites]|uniref:Uncharacterized protein n=1 Tax=Leucocoprinus leucothites TaxID=201217 RepID=A0A8H5GFV4_9AGAR|nr:hypothetical protein D9756_001063 [Leucoagaricus leucothites]
MVLPLPKLVAASFTGALAYGLYLATLLVCLRWLLFRGKDDGCPWGSLRKACEIRWTILFTTFLIFACTTVYVALVLHETMEAAWEATTHTPPPTPSQIVWRSIVICTTANVVVLSADAILIYRCWVVYGKRLLIVVFPSFFWLGALVCTILQIYLQDAHVHNPSISPYRWAAVSMSFGPGIVLLPFWISTVLLNAYATAALIRRIYGPAKNVRQYISVKHLHLAIRIIAESGLLNLSITFAHLLVWFGDKEFPVTIIGMLNAPVTGIAFNWFLLRFEQTKAENIAATDSGSNGPNLTTIQFDTSLLSTQESRNTSPQESPIHFISLSDAELGHPMQGKETGISPP